MHLRSSDLRGPTGRLVASALVFAGCAATPRSRVVESGLVIDDATIVSPERAEPRVADVVIRDGRIAEIGRDLVAGAGAQRIDARGRFLVPGLIDSHVHLAAIAMVDAPLELMAAQRTQIPRAFLAFGFTTVIDVNITPEARRWFEATPLHPRLYHCGQALRIAGGYGALRVPPDADAARFPYLLHEPDQTARWPATLEPSDHTPARGVERVVAAGGICVKTFVEPGFGMFDWPVPRTETLRALRTATSERGLKLLVHATGVQGWQAAIDARADVIVHGLWHWPGDRASATPPREAHAVIEAAARADLRVQPTVRVLRNEQAVFDASILDDPRIEWALPSSVLAYLRSEPARAARREMAAELGRLAPPPGPVALLDVAVRRVQTTLRAMLDARVTLVLGSDTPADEGIGNPPGLNGRLELQEWAAAGVPLAHILRAATLDNAAAFGLARELGSIEIGKRADLVLLSANPLEDIAAYDAIEIVFLNGEPIARAALRPTPSR